MSYIRQTFLTNGTLLASAPKLNVAPRLTSSYDGTSTVTLDFASGVVTPGTYDSLVVDTYGRVTSGSTPATVYSGDVSGTGTYGVALTLAAVGTAGTYSFVGTDAKGRVVSGGNLAVTGDATGTAAGGTLILTLPTSGVTAGTYNSLTVNAKGLVTAASTLAYLTGNQTITISGDASGSGTTGITLTLGASGVTSGIYANLTVNAKGLVTAARAINATDVTTALGFTPVNNTAVGAVSGIATLNSSGQLTASQIPAALVGAVVYQGVWNANTNTPPLVSGVGAKGNYYKVSVVGSTTINGLSQWNIGDTIIFNGTTWDKIDGIPSEVASVNGQVGTVTITTITGNAGSATALAAGQPIVLAGAVTGNATFAGNTGATISTTLAASGVSAGTYSSLVVNSFGIVTSGLALAVTGDITGTASGATLSTTLTAVGTPGTYASVITNAAGQVISGKSWQRGTASGATYTVNALDTYVGVTYAAGASTIIIPTGSSEGRQLLVKDEIGNAFVNNVTINASGTEKIDNVTMTLMNVNYQAINLVYSASSWWIV